jgi:hypothetical protein
VSSFGNTKEKAIANLEDAIRLMLEPISDNLYANNLASEQVELVKTSKNFDVFTLIRKKYRRRYTKKLG